MGIVYGPYESREALDEVLTRKWADKPSDEFLIFQGELAKNK
jgi:hypothetical protein